jgi:hypothetical protein
MRIGSDAGVLIHLESRGRLSPWLMESALLSVELCLPFLKIHGKSNLDFTIDLM